MKTTTKRIVLKTTENFAKPYQTDEVKLGVVPSSKGKMIFRPVVGRILKSSVKDGQEGEVDHIRLFIAMVKDNPLPSWSHTFCIKSMELQFNQHANAFRFKESKKAVSFSISV